MHTRFHSLCSLTPPPPPLCATSPLHQAKFGNDAIKQLAERKRQEAALAGDGIDVNLIPIGTRVGGRERQGGRARWQAAGLFAGAAIGRRRWCGVEATLPTARAPRLLLPAQIENKAAEEEEAEPIPDVEWWDARILVDKSSYGNAAGGARGGGVGWAGRWVAPRACCFPCAAPHHPLLPPPSGAAAEGEIPPLREGRITLYVEHPVMVEPPAEAPPPPPQPLKLTKRELKKLRTQRRQAREQEKQELIAQGLLEPPKPKVKISNLMRVLGTEATLGARWGGGGGALLHGGGGGARSARARAQGHWGVRRGCRRPTAAATPPSQTPRPWRPRCASRWPSGRQHTTTATWRAC